ncbi:hypothetical protein SRHO_G00154870 [Serrasalmus rhombeus]
MCMAKPVAYMVKLVESMASPAVYMAKPVVHMAKLLVYKVQSALSLPLRAGLQLCGSTMAEGGEGEDEIQFLRTPQSAHMRHTARFTASPALARPRGTWPGLWKRDAELSQVCHRREDAELCAAVGLEVQDWPK